jgi:Flp pilus assembly pilin Flp
VNQVLRLFDAFKREEGQTMAEYGVVLAVITIAVFGALALLSGNIVNAITRVAGSITYDLAAGPGGLSHGDPALLRTQ